MSISVAAIIIPLLRAILAAVLVAAGAAKLADIRSFATTLLALGVSAQKGKVAHRSALALSLIEVIIGLATISGLWLPVINGVVFLLMSGFTLVTLIALRKAPTATCRCFGALSDSQFSIRGLIRSLLLTVGAFSVFWWSLVTPSFQLRESLGSTLLLIAGYSLFALGAAQAATVIALVKERVSA